MQNKTKTSSAQSKEHKKQQRNRLLMVVNNPAFFLSHRLEIALAAKAKGYEVHIATMDGPAVKTIQSYGLMHHSIALTRSGNNPFQELYSIFDLWRLFRRLKPNVIHAVTIKPVLYGGIAARLAAQGRFLAAISGLGYIFTQNTGWLRRMVMLLYRFAFKGQHTRVIFQNEYDQNFFLQSGILQPEQCVLIPGSGVDTKRFFYVPEPIPPITILMVARLLKDKGVREYVEAARLSQAAGFNWQWQLAGSPDPGNPTSVKERSVLNWQAQGLIHWLGERQDIDLLYQQSHIAVLPSYREGLPKSLIEAAASGRPVVTTQVPGCQDAIIANKTGLLVPVKDSQALFQAVQKLAMNAGLRQKMGQAGRELALNRFSIEKIVQAHLTVYEQMAH